MGLIDRLIGFYRSASRTSKSSAGYAYDGALRRAASSRSSSGSSSSGSKTVRYDSRADTVKVVKTQSSSGSKRDAGKPSSGRSARPTRAYIRDAGRSRSRTATSTKSQPTAEELQQMGLRKAIHSGPASASKTKQDIEQKVMSELRKGTPAEELEKKYGVKIEEKKVTLKVDLNKITPGKTGQIQEKENVQEKIIQKSQDLDDRLSPTLGMVAKEGDVKTLLEGERRINKMAKEGDIGAIIYMGGKVASLWAEDIMTKTKEVLPLEDKGPVIGGKTVGEQI